MLKRKRQTTKTNHGCLAYACLLLGLGISLLGLVSANTFASSRINAVVCSNDPPLITLTSPIDNSVVNSSTIRLSGVAIRTTQIDISLNDVPVQPIAIGDNPSFDVSLGLNKGQNIIKLDAYFSCNQLHTVKTVSVSMVPSSTNQAPSSNSNSGGSDGGEAEPDANSYNVVSPDNGGKASHNQDDSKSSKPSRVDRVRRNLGLAPTSGGKIDIVRPVYSWLSVLVMIASIAVFIAPSMVVTRVDSKSRSSTGKGTKNIRRVVIVIRLVALIVAIIFGVIIQL